MEKLLWEIAFALAAIGGVVGLWALQRSAAKDALGAARQAWQQQATSREKAIGDKADKMAADLEAMRLEAARRAVDWEAKVRATEQGHAQKLRDWENEKTGMEHAKEALERAAEKFRPDHANIENLRQRLDDMRNVWLGDSSEWECQRVLAKNLWVLSPDYVVGKFKMYVKGTVPISTILRAIFPVNQGNGLTAPVGEFIRPDLCGWVEARGLGPAATASAQRSGLAEHGGVTKAERVFLIIELKKSSRQLNWKMMEQAHAYAWYLLQNATDLQKHRIECLVIGKSCDEVNDAHLRWGSGPHDAIRIIPISYNQLYERAKALAHPYVEKQFGRQLDEPFAWNIDTIDAVPEVTEGESLAGQVRQIDSNIARQREMREALSPEQPGASQPESLPPQVEGA